MSVTLNMHAMQSYLLMSAFRYKESNKMNGANVPMITIFHVFIKTLFPQLIESIAELPVF